MSNAWYSALAADCRASLAQGRAFVAIVSADLTPPPGYGLTPAEQARAARYAFDADRHAFRLGRQLTRALLLDPGEPEDFTLSEHGKPFLPGAPGFNLSHSGGFVAVIIGASPWLGIDIEIGPRDGAFHPLIGPLCHPVERAYLAGRDLSAFLKCWTRKEALLKARGTGIGDDLPLIDTRLAETTPLFPGPPALAIHDLPLSLEGAGPSLIGAVALPPGLGAPVVRV